MPVYRATQATVLTFAHGASWPVRGYRATCPPGILNLLQDDWDARPGRRKRNAPDNLPTRSLRDLLTLIDPDITAVHWNPRHPAWLRARTEIDPDLLLIGLSAWASAHVAPHVSDTDWYGRLEGAGQFEWIPEDIDLAQHDLRSNGTANPPAHVFELLPSLVAEQLTTTGLQLLGHHRDLRLGPTRADGRRTLHLGQPESLVDEDGAAGASVDILTFHLETVPGVPEAHLHLDLGMTRFATNAVDYIPRRGYGDPTATVLLAAKEGFIHRRERPMLLESSIAIRRRGQDTSWAWQPGVTSILARLTHHEPPSLDELRSAPGNAAVQPFAAHLVHSTGMTYRYPGQEGAPPVRATHDHPVGHGYQPCDHMEVLTQVARHLEDKGLVPLRPTPKARTRAKTRLPLQLPDSPAYELEVWASSDRTWQCLQTAAGKLGLAPAASTPDRTSFTGPINLTLQRHDPHDLTAGLPRSTESDPAARRAAYEASEAERATRIARAFPRLPHPIACIVEMEGTAYFTRTRQRDPKPLFKQVLPSLRRNVQCLRPIPPANPNPSKAALAKRFPGTDFSTTDIERAASALRDALRQAGHLPKLPAPPGIEEGPFELITVWLAPAGERMLVPMLIRQHTHDEPTAQLMTTTGSPAEHPMPLTALPEALVAGRGRVPRTARAALAGFLTNALSLDSTADRLLLVRRARTSDNDIWPWLQDSRITFDQLVLPGIDITTSNADPIRRKPDDQPGLRIIRLRERSDRSAVPRAFGVSQEMASADGTDDLIPVTRHGRFSGLVEVGERAFWGINPRSDQNQTPLTLTKFNPAQPTNRTWTCSNPSSLEIVPAFLQDGDNPADWAMYVHAQRRLYAHTSIATTWPAIVHLAELMEEYIS